MATGFRPVCVRPTLALVAAPPVGTRSPRPTSCVSRPPAGWRSRLPMAGSRRIWRRRANGSFGGRLHGDEVRVLVPGSQGPEGADTRRPIRHRGPGGWRRWSVRRPSEHSFPASSPRSRVAAGAGAPLPRAVTWTQQLGLGAASVGAYCLRALAQHEDAAYAVAFVYLAPTPHRRGARVT